MADKQNNYIQFGSNEGGKKNKLGYMDILRLGKANLNSETFSGSNKCPKSLFGIFNSN